MQKELELFNRSFLDEDNSSTKLLLILDTETTGLSVSEGHRIVEIGCVEIKDLIPTKRKFHCFLNPAYFW